MYNEDIVQRLRIDPGQRTLGELCQDREAALREILRLRTRLERFRKPSTSRPSPPLDFSKDTRFRSGTFLTIKQVSEMFGFARSTIYRRISEGSFPKPERFGPRTVRWSVDELVAWREALAVQDT